jgi:hypothetical protein
VTLASVALLMSQIRAGAAIAIVATVYTQDETTAKVNK